eukprot:symbB.v1.2.030355.t1/scaffold3411.1/size57358/12
MRSFLIAVTLAPAAANVEAWPALHPAAQVQRWKQRLRGWLWNPELTPQEANDIYDALLQSEYMETVAECSDVVAALGARSCWEGALRVWNSMGCKPDLIAFKTAVRAVGNAGQWQLAMLFLESAISTRLDLDKELLFHATSALSEGRQWMRALPLLQEAQLGRTAPDVSCYTAAIRALSLGTQPSQTLWLLNDVINIQLQPTDGAFEAAIRSCGELGEWKRALAYLDYMFQGGLVTNAFCTCEAMQTCAMCGQWSEALRLFHEISEQKITRPVKSFSIALEVCEKSGLWEEAVHIFNDFVEKGGIVEEDFVEPLLRACLQAGQVARVKEYLHELDKLGFIPTYALSRFVATASSREIPVP